MYVNDGDYISGVNKTYSALCSKRQMLPSFIIDKLSHRDMTDKVVLDYGAGKEIYGTKYLRESGKFKDIIAYDIGKNVSRDHNTNALFDKYDVVMMSNVVNVQPSIEEIFHVLVESRNVLVDGGIFFCNYPKQPRKCNVSGELLRYLLKSLYCKVDWNKFNDGIIFVCEV